MRPEWRLLVAGLAATLVAGCAVRPVAAPPPQSGSATPPALPADPVPVPEPRSRYGNGPIYEVYGVPYRVLPTSYGYKERGVASWYGPKFHGRPTSSQEPFDMHQLTAAHKTLPLPTFARVRNLKNGRSVVVRINDRGPFVANRLIDLSFAAARRLDLVQDGTGLVEVEAISFDAPPQAAAATPAAEPLEAQRVYLQVGAFGERGNAERRHRLLVGHGIDGAFVYEETGRESPLYRVRIGPINEVEQYDSLVASLAELGIAESHLVTD